MYPTSGQIIKSEYDRGYSQAMVMLDHIKNDLSKEKQGYPPSSDYYKAICKAIRIIDKYRG